MLPWLASPMVGLSLIARSTRSVTFNFLSFGSGRSAYWNGQAVLRDGGEEAFSCAAVLVC